MMMEYMMNVMVMIGAVTMDVIVIWIIMVMTAMVMAIFWQGFKGDKALYSPFKLSPPTKPFGSPHGTLPACTSPVLKPAMRLHAPRRDSDDCMTVAMTTIAVMMIVTMAAMSAPIKEIDAESSTLHVFDPYRFRESVRR